MKRIFTRSFIIIVFLFSGILLQAQSSTFKPGIVLTWDDRAVDEWHDIIPILNKYSAVTTFFISEPFYITESQMDSLVDLINAGYEIGSHGWAHLDGPDYVANNSYEAYINDEILPSLQWAKDSFNVDVTSFAYPFGSFSYALNDTLYYNKYFNVLRATAATDVYQPVDLYRPYIDEYNRNGIVWGVGIDSSYGNTLDELKAAFLKTKNENSVLVLYGHDPVEDPNYDYQTKLSTLDSLLSYAHSLDLEFYTAKNLGGIIESNNTYTPDYFINVGGSHIYNGGHHWIPEADNIFHGGNTTSNSFSIENTIEDTIFNSARYGNLTYEIPLGNGDFDVNLYFAETYFVEGGGGGPGIGRRVFNVYIEGVRVLENFDINAESQVDVPYAIIRTFPVSISDSILNIEFESLTDNAILSGMTIQATGNQDNSPPAALLQSFSIFGNAPLTSNFDASLSYDPVGAISNYSWTFADGSTGNGPTINHTYNTAGVYKVELLVTDDGGLTDTAWVNVTVLTTNEPPVAVAEALPVAGNAPLEVTFIGGASTDDNDTISSYSWDFADGNTGEGDTIVHTFTAEGTYHVELVITDNGGLTDTTFVDITVSPNEPPVASAEATPLTGDAPLDVDFDASASNDPDGSIESYAWDFDDGNTGTGEILSHTFNTPGDYQVEVVITDNGGLTDTARIDITVNVPNQPPVASAEATPTTGHAALDVDFDASASNDPDGTIITYAWDFDDGNTGTGIAVSHTFLTQGDYHVELVVTDNEGLTDTLWIDINVTAPNLPPVASAEAAPVSGDYPLEVSFDGSASTDSDGTISSYAWDFDDGSTGTGETVTHSYLTQGIYEAVLTVTDDDGATDTDTVEISVTEPVPFIEVISPNGGEQLQVGTLFDITWTSFGTSGNVHIEYSVTNGSAWSDVIASTPDNGLYSWTIPNDPSFECLIRISDTDANPTDQSNAIFRISSDPPLHFVPVWINNGQDHMNFYAKTAKIEGLDMQSGDEIGIFDGIYCIGSGRITEVLNGTTSILDIRVSKDDLGTPEADGYTPGHIANFRIWDSINQREIVNVEITFDSGSDTLKVGESAWFHINGVNQVTQNISLQNGWNIFSLYVIPENISMLNIVQPLIDQNRLVKVQNESGASIEQIPNTTTWINQIGNWNIEEGYKIRVNASATALQVTGYPITDPVDINLPSGWSIISFPSSGDQYSEDVLADLMGSTHLVKVQDEAGASIEQIPGTSTWMNQIGDFESGEGYKVRVTALETLTIDPSLAGTSSLLKSTATRNVSEYFAPVWKGNGYDHMNIYLTGIEEGLSGLEAGDEIGIFDGPICVGSGVIQETNARFHSFVASADDPTTRETDGFTEGNQLSFKLWRPSTNQEISLNNVVYSTGGSNVYEPMGTTVVGVNLTTLGLKSGVEQLTSLGDNYPNPLSGTTTIPFVIGTETAVDISIYNILGKKVNTLVHENLQPGNYTAVWNATDGQNNRIMSGIYFCKMIAGEQVFVKMIEVINK